MWKVLGACKIQLRVAQIIVVGTLIKKIDGIGVGEKFQEYTDEKGWEPLT